MIQNHYSSFPTNIPPKASKINTTTASTIPTTFHTPALSQLLESTRLAPLDTTTPAFSHADHSPLHVMPPTSILNKVCDFQKRIKHNITLYPILKDDQQYDN